jgi:drug/metabolite transporter (DMT)-like permease
VGPGFLFLERAGAPPLLLITWRMQCVFLYLLPFSAYEVWTTPRRVRRTWLEADAVRATVLAGIGWGGTLVCYVVSLLFTSTVRGSLLSSLTPLVLLIQYRWAGKRITRGELWGALLATAGMAICFLSSTDPERSPDFGLVASAGGAGGVVPTAAAIVAGHALLGDVLATAASVFTALDVEYSVAARQSIPLFVFSSACAAVATLVATVCAVVLEGATLSVSLNGLFGWLLPAYLLPMLLFAFAVGFLAILGFNHSVKYVPPLVFSVIILLDPVLTGLLSFEVGLESLPTFWTLTGGTVVLAGIAIVVVSEGERHH